MNNFLKENWFKLIIAVAVLIVVLSVGWYFIIFLPKNQPAQSNIISLQKACASQAKEIFNLRTGDNSVMGTDYTYQDHYNNNLSKCYVLITGMRSDGQTNLLMDAYENKTIAECESYGGTLMNQDFCSYNSSNEEWDIGKFDGFIKSYMEN